VATPARSANSNTRGNAKADSVERFAAVVPSESAACDELGCGPVDVATVGDDPEGAGELTGGKLAVVPPGVVPPPGELEPLGVGVGDDPVTEGTTPFCAAIATAAALV
jgi:hypothetical protein